VTVPLPVDVEHVIARSALRRAERAVVAWRTLRPYERRVVHEAAVMGYVLGHRDGRLDGDRFPFGKQDFPGDTAIVRSVIEACDGMPDRFPYLHVACGGRRRRITRKRLWPGEEPTP